MRELPQGYVRVSVLVTTKEYEKLQSAATVTPRGTMSEAVRYLMGWQYVPQGFLKAAGIATRHGKKRMKKPFEVRNYPSTKRRPTDEVRMS